MCLSKNISSYGPADSKDLEAVVFLKNVLYECDMIFQQDFQHWYFKKKFWQIKIFQYIFQYQYVIYNSNTLNDNRDIAIRYRYFRKFSIRYDTIFYQNFRYRYDIDISKNFSIRYDIWAKFSITIRYDIGEKSNDTIR